MPTPEQRFPIATADFNRLLVERNLTVTDLAAEFSVTESELRIQLDSPELLTFVNLVRLSHFLRLDVSELVFARPALVPA